MLHTIDGTVLLAIRHHGEPKRSPTLTSIMDGSILATRMEIKKDTAKKYALKQKRGTTLTFTADELTALARYISAGMVLLQTSHPVLGRIRGGLTRLGLESPPGL